MVSANVRGGGDVGPSDVRRDCAAGSRGDGCDVRRKELPVVTGVGVSDEKDDGRDGKSCDSLFDPDVFFRVSGGRTSHGALLRSVAGEPTRSVAGTASTDSFRPTIC